MDLGGVHLTHCAHSAAQLAGVDEKTVTRYVAMRDARWGPRTVRVRRLRSIDPFLPTIEELVDKSPGQDPRHLVAGRLAARAVRWHGPHDAAGGGRDQDGVAGREPAQLPAVDPGTGVVLAGRLGRGGLAVVNISGIRRTRRACAPRRRSIRLR
jgi:hypothetical protein